MDADPEAVRLMLERERTRHITGKEMREYVAKETGEMATAKIEGHMKRCPECKAIYLRLSTPQL